MTICVGGESLFDTAQAVPERFEIRPATSADIDLLARLITAFAAGHPAADHPRSTEALHDAYFSDASRSRILLAFDGTQAAGFAGWDPAFDMFWTVPGGQAIGLFVERAYRGRGLAACLIAALCRSVEEAGGQFLRATYDESVAPLYERVAVGRDLRECHLSARAFREVAALAGAAPREIVAALPTPELNQEP